MLWLPDWSALNLVCAFRSTEMWGTSMASPIVAGTATLARQYFLDGFYPSGSKVCNVLFEHSYEQEGELSSHFSVWKRRTITQGQLVT